MILPPTSKEYDREWVAILRLCDLTYTRELAHKYWPHRLPKDFVMDEMLYRLEVPEDVDLDSPEVLMLRAHAWGYYSKWYRQLFAQQGQQLTLF